MKAVCCVELPRDMREYLENRCSENQEKRSRRETVSFIPMACITVLAMTIVFWIVGGIA